MQQREERELLNSRITVILGMVVLVFIVLGFGFWRHQILESPYYSRLAERNRIRDVRLSAPRGRILDREHRVIADSRPSFSLVIDREDTQRSAAETIRLLAPGIESAEDELLERFNEQLDDVAYLPIVLKDDLAVSEIAFVEAHQYELPEVSLEFRPRRRYEGGELAAHLLGYVGEITQQQIASGEFPERTSGDIVGKSGLERQYDAVLQGQDGIRRVIVDNVSREMGILGEVSPVAGQDLVTTLDLDLQRAAESALAGRTGVAVAMRPQSGEILALSSRPAFDPTLFAEGIAQADWQSLLSDPRKPLQNRAIQNHYSPGSVFKIFMTAAALEEHVLGADEAMFCPGHAVLYGNSFACWRAGGHGRVGLHNALVQSCNVFFYHVGDRLGIELISEYAAAMGLGRKTGIDLPGEVAGLVPSEAWKRQVLGDRWYPGETISVSIGQGALSVTPLQLTWAVGGFASGGELAQPHFVEPTFLREIGVESQDIVRERYPVGEESVATVAGALWDVVNGGGTGTRARVEGFDVAGKTGTAQVVGRAAYGTREEFEDHAWFVGFAPHDDPEIVVGVFVENGGGGGATAAPIAQAILQTYFDKRVGPVTRAPSGELAGVR